MSSESQPLNPEINEGHRQNFIREGKKFLDMLQTQYRVPREEVLAMDEAQFRAYRGKTYEIPSQEKDDLIARIAGYLLDDQAWEGMSFEERKKTLS